MQLSKSQLVNNINAEISDQSYGQISPYDIRHNLLDIIDSISNLTLDKNLESLNFATFSDGNTRVGISALDNVKIDNSISNHNTAIGFNSLRSNYQSVQNTAIGSHSLSCNVYGEGNVAVGYNALAGNTVGHLNIGIGNYTLNNNKSGNGNIAIGHGAGYYATKNTSNHLFIGYHPVDDQHICDNPNGSGWMPLIYGDLSNIKLGIGTKSLNNYGVLHVGGNILPSGSNVSSLGYDSYFWSKLYLSRSIEFSNLSSIFSSGSSLLCTSNHIYPSQTNKYSLGSNSYVWESGFFKDLTVTGRAIINQLFYSNVYTYSNKTFYLGVNSNNQPLYSDLQLSDGGVVLKSSTNNKEYKISFRPPAEGMPGFVDDYNAVWFSNINLQVPSNRYVKTNSLISYDPDAFDDNDSFGLFFNSGITYISRKNVLGSNLGLPNGHVAGISNINLISNSGSIQDYSISLMSLESGVSVSQKFLTGTKQRIKDSANQNKDKLKGFELKYVDESFSNIVGPLLDRFVIASYNNTSKPINALTLMKQNADGGVVGITNMSSIADNVTPKTIFNIRSINDCVARFTAESNGYHKAAIQLLGSSNCESSGIELTYLNNSGIADINLFKNYGTTCFVRFKDDQQIGILSSGITNATITIGHSGAPKLPTISLKDDTFVANTTVVANSGYGKLYNLRDVRQYANQYNSLIYLDSSGNKFDVVVNKLDNIDGRAVYTDTSGNTFAGYASPSNRKITSSIKENTTHGYQALYDIRSGSGNLAIGHNALYNLFSGNDNIAIGRFAGSGLLSSVDNIIIGNQAFNKTSPLNHTSGNIIIGHNIGASQSGSYQFILGNRSNIILLQGKLGPNNTDKFLSLPSSGRLYVHNHDNTEGLCLKSNLIEIIDSGGSNYPENDLRFRFIGNNSADLLVLNHNSNPNNYNSLWGSPALNVGSPAVSYVDEYWFPSSGVASDSNVTVSKPYAQLNGNLRLKGNIQFSDGTYLGSTKPIHTNTRLANSGIALGNSGIAIAHSGINLTNSMFIEGYMPTGMNAAPNSSAKTSGILITKDVNWSNSGVVFLTNRDTTSVVHAGAYVIAAKINNEYRPIWVSSSDTTCVCCNS
jgi:hypothetical protein